jgi:hypothetical protein
MADIDGPHFRGAALQEQSVKPPVDAPTSSKPILSRPAPNDPRAREFMACG